MTKLKTANRWTPKSEIRMPNEILRAEAAIHVKAYLKAGGKVTYIPIGVTSNNVTTKYDLRFSKNPSQEQAK